MQPCISCGRNVRYLRLVKGEAFYVSGHRSLRLRKSHGIKSLPCDVNEELECDICRRNLDNCRRSHDALYDDLKSMKTSL